MHWCQPNILISQFWQVFVPHLVCRLKIDFFHWNWRSYHALFEVSSIELSAFFYKSKFIVFFRSHYCKLSVIVFVLFVIREIRFTLLWNFVGFGIVSMVSRLDWKQDASVRHGGDGGAYFWVFFLGNVFDLFACFFDRRHTLSFIFISLVKMWIFWGNDCGLALVDRLVDLASAREIHEFLLVRVQRILLIEAVGGLAGVEVLLREGDAGLPLALGSSFCVPLLCFRDVQCRCVSRVDGFVACLLYGVLCVDSQLGKVHGSVGWKFFQVQFRLVPRQRLQLRCSVAFHTHKIRLVLRIRVSWGPSTSSYIHSYVCCLVVVVRRCCLFYWPRSPLSFINRSLVPH